MMKQDRHMIETDNAIDDSFDNFLTKQLQSSSPYLADENFAANVMAKLPAAKKLSVWQERLIILIPFFVISILVISQFSILSVLVKLWSFLVAVQVSGLLQIGLITMLIAISSASYWFAKQFKLI